MDKKGFSYFSSESRLDDDNSYEETSIDLQSSYFPGFDLQTFKTKSHQEFHKEEEKEEEEQSSPEMSKEDNNMANTWDVLAEIIKNELEKTRRKKGTKRRTPKEYEVIIDSLRIHSEDSGFTDEELEIIWKIVSSPAPTLNCTQRRKLLHSMLPKYRVGEGLVKSILQWLQNAHSRGFKPTVIVSVYQLLNLYTEYRLLEDNSVMNDELLTRILNTETENFVIPWRMRLFTNVVTPAILTQLHVICFNGLLKIKNLKKTHIDDINAAIGVCKLMRPDLFSNFNINCKPRSLNFPSDSLKRFYLCRVRTMTMSQSNTDVHPMADRIFPEFLPNTYRSGPNTNILEKVFTCLENDHGIMKVAHTPSLLISFEEWLQKVIRHRFNCFSGVSSSHEDYLRYTFIFLVCYKLTWGMQTCLPALREWVCNFLGNWDFLSFKKFVDDLIPFIQPQDILPKRHTLRKTLVSRFLHSSSVRFVMWETLENMYKTWMLEHEVNSDGIEWILSVMDSMMTCLVHALDAAEPASFTLLDHICEFYLQMQQTCVEQLNLNGDLKLKMMHIPNALIALVVLADYRGSNTLKLLIEVIRARTTNSSNFKTNSGVDDNSLALTSIFCGNLCHKMNLENEELRRNSTMENNEFTIKAENLKVEWLENIYSTTVSSSDFFFKKSFGAETGYDNDELMDML